MRLIDADRFDNELDELKKHADIHLSAEVFRTKVRLATQPTVDAEPIRHGHWITGLCFSQGIYDYPEYDKKCSVCQKYSRDFSTYCPNCGAKMDEVTEK